VNDISRRGTIMKKIDPVVVKETIYIAVSSLILSALLQAVFLIIGKWDYTILLGNILGYVAAAGNFLTMGLSVQKAVEMNEKDAKARMKASQSFRMLFLFIIAVIGYAVPVFNTIAVVIPLLFPRVAILLRPLFNKK
jgi:amino acid permease